MHFLPQGVGVPENLSWMENDALIVLGSPHSSSLILRVSSSVYALCHCVMTCLYDGLHVHTLARVKVKSFLFACPKNSYMQFNNTRDSKDTGVHRLCSQTLRLGGK